jgi:2-aminoadipate transaminase
VAERALYLGSFSKVGSPGLRLGWVRAPEPARQALTIVKQSADLHTSTLDQAALAAYLESADLDAHVRTLRTEYTRRRDAMLAALATHMPEDAVWNRPRGGMFLWLCLPRVADTAELVAPALDAGVAFVPGAAFYAGTPDRSTMRLSFATHTPAEIAEGVARLAGVLP